MSSSNGHRLAVLDMPKDRCEYFGGKIDLTHAFAPRDPARPWGLCRCGLAESAHVATTSPYAATGTYRCPECVVLEKPSCGHPRAGEQPLL